jgi:hypothetical protein
VLGDNRRTSVGIKSLSAKEQEIVPRCMKADDLQQEIARWPNIDDRDESSDGFLAINNSLLVRHANKRNRINLSIMACTERDVGGNPLRSGK